MSQPLLIDQHIGSATYIETMRDEFILNSLSKCYTRLIRKIVLSVGFQVMLWVCSKRENTLLLEKNAQTVIWCFLLLKELSVILQKPISKKSGLTVILADSEYESCLGIT